MIRRHGIIGATERAVNRADETVAFSALREAGLSQFAFEAVILRHAPLFSEAAVERARKRMSKFGHWTTRRRAATCSWKIEESDMTEEEAKRRSIKETAYCYVLGCAWSGQPNDSICLKKNIHKGAM